MAYTMEVRESRDELVGRVRVLSGVLALGLLVVLAGFWSVQIASGEQYLSLAENNRLRRQEVDALRGVVVDRQGRILVENVPSYNLLIHPPRTSSPEASTVFASGILGAEAGDLLALFERGRKVSLFEPVLLAENLSLEEVARFGVAGFEHPEFEIQVRHLRLYRHGPQTAHVLGYLAEVTERELADAELPYRSGDQVGRRGIERTYDRHLRGKNGERVVVVDSRGRLVEEFQERPAQEGHSLRLTLDLELQQEATEQLRDKVGAVVALDPRDGAVRAMVSSPSYDPNLFSRRLKSDEWRALVEAPNDPLQNRAVQNTYSPGSPFKIIMAAAGLQEGFVTPHDTVWCGGSAKFYDRRFRCWKRSGHGRVNLREALKKSCDIYFYDLGQRLGVERIAKYSRLFGLGRPTGIDLAGEKSGIVPDLEWSNRVRGTAWYPGETISVAIGQGPLLSTPLQVAVATAVVANRGQRIVPHLRKGQGQPAEPIPELQRAVIEEIRQALWAVVNEPQGTGSQARVPGLAVAGKTGTVQVVAQRTWVDSDTLPAHQRDHAWFTSFAPANDPQLVVAVFVEHGGKGSEAAAPIARALYETYFKADLVDHGAI